MKKFALAVHGGAGTIVRSGMTPELEDAYHGALRNAVEAGTQILKADGSALDAVEAAVVVLEDFPLFNAGRGAVFAHDGAQELDASIMEGANFRAGAIAAVRNVRNPIKLARLVMERTPHVLLAGKGADRFAAEMGVTLEADEYFFTDLRWAELQDALEAGEVRLDHSPGHIGTVGAVACDRSGRLAAATSTGGMTNKKFGRVGDTPLIGSGTYADDLCAVSCTGHGEFFILAAAAHDVSARMHYLGADLTAATDGTVGRLTKIGGEGGLIAVDAHGSVALPFNSAGMYRGWAVEGEEPKVAIYGDCPDRSNVAS